MSDAALAAVETDEPPDLSVRPSAMLRRDADLLGRSNSACRDFLRKKIEGIVRGFEDQVARSDDLDQWWRIYHCELDDNQFYNGNAQVYVPIIRDAINARTTRHANQLFPAPGRYVDVTSTDGHIPFEIVALMNHYIRGARLKTQVVKPLLRNGDIEGQYNLYVDWQEIDRQVVSRETRPLKMDGQDVPPDLVGEDAEVIDIIEEEIVDGCPVFEVLHDADVVVLPASADSVDEALAQGGSVTIVRRWSKEKYEDMIEAGEIAGDGSDDEGPRLASEAMTGLNDLEKKLARAVGIRAKGPHVLMFETWLMVPLGEKGGFGKKGKRRLCRMWWNLDREPEGLRRNPYWNDRCPLLSAPVEKVAGVFKGQSLVEPLAPVQYEANDAANERADVDHYSAMPMVRRTPGQGNKPIVLNLGAIIDAGPGDIEFMQFPDLSARARARIMDAIQIIFQSLSVNPSMLPMQVVASKRNQAMVAQEQQIDLLTTSEAVQVPEENILTPMVAWIADLDYQFRDGELTTRAYGRLGIRAEMIDVPPLRNRAQYSFRWCGAEQTKFNIAMQQQATAFINVVRGMRQEIEAEGYRLRLGDVLEQAALNIFGGQAPLVIEDQRHQMTIEASVENEMLMDGHMVPTQPADNDIAHLKEHMPEAKRTGDPHGTFRIHIAEHLKQMEVKAKMAMMQQMAQAGGMPGAPGVPGGAGPGVSGTPRGAGPPQPGAQPQGPRMLKGPPGMIAPERLPRAGAVVPPRRF
jgi:hypothetical protein